MNITASCWCLFFSFVIMASIEITVFLRQIRPIRAALVQENATLPMLEEAYLHAHQLPKRAIQRIMGPHLLGLSVPALLLTFWMIHAGWVTFPYIYLILAMCCAVLVACMHSLIEFFLTCTAIIPLIKEFRNRALEQYGVDFALEGHVFVPIRPKFLVSCMLIGTFPLFLFIMATHIRMNGEGGFYSCRRTSELLGLGGDGAADRHAVLLHCGLAADEQCTASDP
ncbi:hypothetical protein ACFTAO_00200 [Paenibacillus rhizoplanae]